MQKKTCLFQGRKGKTASYGLLYRVNFVLVLVEPNSRRRLNHTISVGKISVRLVESQRTAAAVVQVSYGKFFPHPYYGVSMSAENVFNRNLVADFELSCFCVHIC